MRLVSSRAASLIKNIKCNGVYLPPIPQSLIDAANDVIDSVNAQKKEKPAPPPKDNVDKACEMKRVLLDRIEKLGAILPANTLDQGRYSVLS